MIRKDLNIYSKTSGHANYNKTLKYGLLAQLVDAIGLEPIKSEFDSLVAHQIMKMTFWEFRVWIVLHVAMLLRVKLSDIYHSYIYNPYSKKEVEEFWNGQERQYGIGDRYLRPNQRRNSKDDSGLL